MAFNVGRLNRVQLAIDVGMNSFEYFLTTQLGASTRFPSLAEKKFNRFVYGRQIRKLYVFVRDAVDWPFENWPVYPQYHPQTAFIP